LSEISDALVLVVSEETGALSMVRDGRIDRGVSMDEARRRVRSLYQTLGEKGLLRRRPNRGNEP
jgi:diadenylate cyclase